MYIVGGLAESLGKIQPVDLQPYCQQGIVDDGGKRQCYFEAYIRKYIFDVVGMSNSGFRIDEALWPRCAPTVNDTSYLHNTYQGKVSDPNTYAMGGVSGHAGFFTNVDDLHSLLNLFLLAEPDSPFLNSTTVDLFIKEYNHSQSSRALGWNTNDHTVVDRGFSASCGTLSPSTYMHIGYTGTLICVDPVRGLIVLLLSNRVYPLSTSQNSRLMSEARTQFTTAVQVAYDKGPS
jgi:CubicO group peptidase (beta-lactamase class C family)